MSEVIQTTLDRLAEIFTITDEVLNDWTGENNLQFPVLLGMIAVKMNWDEKQVREADPLIRFYIRNNPDWYVTRGAHGGIMRSSDKQKKELAKANKDAIKKQMQAIIDAKVAEAVSKLTAENNVMPLYQEYE
jgi:hypothetical protein